MILKVRIKRVSCPKMTLAKTHNRNLIEEIVTNPLSKTRRWIPMIEMMWSVEFTHYPLRAPDNSSNYQLQISRARAAYISRIYWAGGHSFTPTHLKASSHGTHIVSGCLPGLPLVYDLDTETNT